MAELLTSPSRKYFFKIKGLEMRNVRIFCTAGPYQRGNLFIKESQKEKTGDCREMCNMFVSV